jgi:Concanavalin A-like lectin/glucanases superfamily
MDLLSLTSITVILILIVGGYLVFTEQISGRPKLIMIAFLGILAIMLVSSLSIFKSYYTIVDTPTPANIPTTLSAKDLPAIKSNASFSISTWIYIQDWNYKFGNLKNILVYNQPGASIPLSFNLDAFENNLIINYNTYSNQFLDSSANSHQIIINNVNIQKWVNIVCCFSANKIDTYINGKLVDTTVNQYPLYVSSVQGDIILGANGGYSGTISNTRYYNKFLSPSEVWDIYTTGYSNNLLGNFLNRYKASFIFYQDNNEITKITI